MVDIPADDDEKVHCYIDDKLAIGLDLSDILSRLEACILQALNIFFGPIDKPESLPRDNAAATLKLIAEEGLKEEKIFLGWKCNTRKAITRSSVYVLSAFLSCSS